MNELVVKFYSFDGQFALGGFHLVLAEVGLVDWLLCYREKASQQFRYTYSISVINP
jgi:hypothetical protein